MTDAKTTQTPDSAEQTTSIPLQVIVELVKHICLVFSNIALYSPRHPAAMQRIQGTFDYLGETLARHGEIGLHMSDGKLLLEGVPVEENNPAVRKLSRHFGDLKVDNLTFIEGVTADELSAFFRVFAEDYAHIEEQGGMEAVFKEEGIVHIRLNTAVYKLIREDETVVGLDQLGAGPPAPGGAAPAAPAAKGDKQSGIVRHFVEQMLKQTENQAALVTRMKNEPTELASQLGDILDHLDVYGDKVTQGRVMETLLQNIEVSAQSIAAAELMGEKKDQEQMAKSMASLESELKRKAKKLASKGATEFLDRIITLVSSYADTARAEAVLNEFIEHEGSLTSAEGLLNDISDDADTSRRVLERLKGIMDERQIEADELLDLLDGDIVEKAKPKKARSKTFKPLATRIQSKLKSDFKDFPDQDGLLAYLDSTFTREVKRLAKEEADKANAKAEKARQQAEKARQQAEKARQQAEEAQQNLAESQTNMAKLEGLLSFTQAGAVVLDSNGWVASVVKAEHVPEVKRNEPPPEALAQAVQTFAEEGAATYDNVEILAVEADDEGQVTAILFGTP